MPILVRPGQRFMGIEKDSRYAGRHLSALHFRKPKFS